jgi:two-component system, OmpR family, phosphate regulon response regulator PhoB
MVVCFSGWSNSRKDQRAMSNEDSYRASLSPPLVLMAAEDDSFTSLVEYIFKNVGLTAVTVSKGTALTEFLDEQTPDVLVLDSRLPGVEVAGLCARLRVNRRTRAIAIIVLVAEVDAGNQRAFLESGADECLERPFSPDQLINRVRTVLREKNRAAEPGEELLTFLDLEMDLGSYRVRRGGRVIELAPTEFRLLHHLIKNPRRVYSRDELKSAAWPHVVNIGPRTVDVHIGRLRAALNEPGGRHLIRTVRSVGYALSD